MREIRLEVFFVVVLVVANFSDDNKLTLAFNPKTVLGLGGCCDDKAAKAL